MSWNGDTGIWKFWVFRGTTPRNAGVWTFDVVLGKWELWTGTGPHGYITLFNGAKEVFNRERDITNCRCYMCNVMRPPTVEEWKAIVDVMKSADLPSTKLPPRPVGCQPSDCCGDPEAHDA